MIFVVVPVLAAVVVGVGIRLGVEKGKDDPTVWHVDPLTSANPKTPNWHRVVPADATVDRDPDRDAHPPTFEVSATDLGAAFDAVATADDRVDVLAGSAADGHVTYVQRSKAMHFPDYVSVRFIDLPDGGSTLAIFSRARYGQKDFDVNKKRVERWIEATEQRLA